MLRRAAGESGRTRRSRVGHRRGAGQEGLRLRVRGQVREVLGLRARHHRRLGRAPPSPLLFSLSLSFCFSRLSIYGNGDVVSGV